MVPWFIYIGDVGMASKNVVKFIVVAYCKACENTPVSTISIERDNLHDAEISRGVFVEINERTNKMFCEGDTENLLWHGYIRQWEGYQLDDGSWVTVSCDAIPELDF